MAVNFKARPPPRLIGPPCRLIQDNERRIYKIAAPVTPASWPAPGKARHRFRRPSTAYDIDTDRRRECWTCAQHDETATTAPLPSRHAACGEPGESPTK